MSQLKKRAVKAAKKSAASRSATIAEMAGASRANKPRLMVVVSDLHCGSDVGLCCPDAPTKSGNTIGLGQNAVQQWLWLCWQSALARVQEIVGNDPFVLVVNGDATEGTHRRTVEIVAATIEEHTEIARLCLEPLAQGASSIFVTKGTECHTAGCETVLAQKLGAQGAEARNKWLVRIAGTLVDIAHHMPCTSRAYLEASAMGIVMGNARQNYMRNQHEIPSVFLRGHRHTPGIYSDGAGLFVVTGAWQALTRYGWKVVTDSVPRPDIKVLDWRSTPDKSLPYVHTIEYIPPQHEITEA